MNKKFHPYIKSSSIVWKFMCKAKLWVRGQAHIQTEIHIDRQGDTHINTMTHP